jgi:flagellar assembly protein FliH
MSFKARRFFEEQAARVEPFRWDGLGGGHAPGGVVGGHDPLNSADVQMRVAAVERDAFAKGYAQGERAGTEAAGTKAEGMLRRLAQTVEELASVRSEIIRRTERQTVQLVLAIAERVVQREIALDRSLLVGMARAALDRLGEYGTATIRLHPDDLHAIGAQDTTEEGPVRIVADPVVTRGGCLVQSDFGFMDASPDAQFRELARALLSDGDTPAGDADPTHVVAFK